MSTDTATVNVVGAAAWDDLLDRIGITDAYLRYGWSAASAVIEEGEPVLLHYGDAGGDVVMPLLVRPVPEHAQLRDAITPYGYGGPIAVGDAPPIEAFHAAARAWMLDQRIVSLFVRFHPLMENHHLALPGTDVGALAGSVGWRLDQARDLELDMHQRHRRIVRKARREGVEVAVVPASESLDAFRALYEETMRRQEAARFYFFPDAYWEALQQHFADQLMIVQATYEGECAAALLLVATHPYVHYHLGASSDTGRRIGASNLCFLTAAQWGQSQGYEVLHLGGGVGGGADSLFEFKSRFDPEFGVRDAYIGKLVVDPEAYASLAGTVSTQGFFPAYRDR